MKIGIVVVSYKNPSMTSRFVKEELSKLTTQFSLVIVNNGSTPEECDKLAHLCEVDRSVIVCSKENLGYAKGNNLGVEVLKRNGNYTHYLFSNDDIEILDPSILEKLIFSMKSQRDIAVIGPKIIGTDDRDQSPHDIYISPYRQIGWELFARFRSKKSIKEQSLRKNEGRYTYWVQGSFMLVDAVAFDSVGGFDANTFLYFEEPILSERLKRIGKHVYYDPTTKVLHYEGQTTVKNNSRLAIENESRLYYYRKYMNVPNIVLFFLNLLMKKQQG